MYHVCYVRFICKDCVCEREYEDSRQIEDQRSFRG